MYCCTLRDLVLYLHKDEHGFRKNQLSDNLHNAIRIHHALATKAIDYTKKQHVFRLQTADQAEYLFQTRYVNYILLSLSDFMSGTETHWWSFKYVENKTISFSYPKLDGVL